MRTGESFALTWNDIDLENKIIKINKTVYSKIKDDEGRWFLGTTKTEGSCREVYICDTLYKALCNYKKQQQLNKKKYGNNYKKYSLEPIKNKYGKIVEYKIIESKYKHRNNVEMVFTRKNGSYTGTDIIKYPFKIIHHELQMNRTIFKQLFFYFATPMLVPIIVGIPAILSIGSIFTIAVTIEEIIRNMMIVFGMLILVYGIYFIATDVQFDRNINESR